MGREQGSRSADRTSLGNNGFDRRAGSIPIRRNIRVLWTQVQISQRARLGAHHGEELFFLSDAFPADWERTDRDQELGKLMRSYWVEFVKAGDPNFDDAPHWPPYEGKSTQFFELGNHVGLRPVPERIRTLATIMQRVVSHRTGTDESPAR